MGKDLTINDRAMVGDCVRWFTFIENDFKKFGSFMDTLVAADDSEAAVESVSSIYLVMTAMQKDITDFVSDLNEYLDVKKHENAEEFDVE